MKKLMTMFLVTTILTLGSMEAYAGTITPYDKQEKPEQFVNGATFVLKQTDDYEEWLSTELKRAHDTYHINTITVYGLEQFDDAYKACLFQTLKELDMKICVRIEGYDGKTFAFTSEDAADVIRRHKSLVEFTCRPENRDVVFYYALNMPVDDGQVQQNLGGVNSEKSRKNQVEYAKEIVRLMRELTAQNGYDNAKMFLSVFFGWDVSYDVPSYAPAGADGYFINNYTYPIAGKLPDSSASEEDIINAQRLKKTMDKFLAVYPKKPPLVVETGFHTLEYNNGVMPGQTGGLVYDRATKEVAVKAIVRFYKENYSNVIGLLYFGYNLFNQEGNPPAEMDWALLYPTEQENDAESAVLGENAELKKDEAAGSGRVIHLKKGGSAVYQECPATQQVVLTYRAAKEAVLQFVSRGAVKKEVTLPASETYRAYGIPLTVVEDYDLEMVCSQGEIYLDKVCFFERMEAEYAQCVGELQIQKRNGASHGYVVEDITGQERALRFVGTRGGDKLLIIYAAERETTLILEKGGKKYSVKLPAATELTELALEIPVAQGEDILLYEEADNGLILDNVAFSGPPAGKADESDGVEQDGDCKTEISGKGGSSVKGLLTGGAAGIVIAGLFVGAAVAYSRKTRRKE